MVNLTSYFKKGEKFMLATQQTFHCSKFIYFALVCQF